MADTNVFCLFEMLLKGKFGRRPSVFLEPRLKNVFHSFYERQKMIATALKCPSSRT
ncbi:MULTISPECIES: hypothetical protein [Heyndrickxia]|uniref:hypothetical protein n=1 Tax=Heyndrickxia TaxID=2837504 RepID=UPI002DB6865D|nr:hypothetical protein [Weizmannia sp. CD-2023]MEC2305396.1 hypothetical protein [Weizmannia sp. CD-2023]